MTQEDAYYIIVEGQFNFKIKYNEIIDNTFK